MLPPSLPLSALPPAYISLALTLLSSQLFASVEPRDVLARLAGLRALKAEWAGELPEPQPPQQGGEDSLARWVEVNTRLGVWASGEVLRGKGRRGRARALERLIDCAEGCRKLSNHSSMSTLLSALNAPPISRLMHTWALVSSHHLELLMRLRDVLPPRTDIAAYSARVELPCVPPLSLFLHTTADTEGPLRLYREIKRYQASCAQYAALVEERLAGLPPPQLHLPSAHSPPVSGSSTPSGHSPPVSGTSTPASPITPPTPGPSSPAHGHTHTHTHHAHHSHHPHQHHLHALSGTGIGTGTGSLSGTSTPGSLHSIPEETDDTSPNSPQSPESRGRSASLDSASTSSSPASLSWWGLPDTPLAPLALQHQLHQLHTPHPPPPPAAGTVGGSYFAYLPHMPRAPSPLRVARPWAERFEERWEREAREEGGRMHVPEGHVHSPAHGEEGEEPREMAGPEGAAEHRAELVRSPETSDTGQAGPGSPHTPTRGSSGPEPGSPHTPSPFYPLSPSSPHPHPQPHKPTSSELLSLLQNTLASVDTGQDLWELSGKAERLTREDIEMREIVMMSERAGVGPWVGGGAL